MERVRLREDEIIKMAAEVGARAALEKLDQQKSKLQKTWHDKRLRNTKLLIKNYRMFQKHVDSAVYETTKMDEKAIDILDLMWSDSNSEFFVESIKKSVARTKIIFEHVKEMIGLYEVYCSRSNKPEDARHYRVVKYLFLEESPKNAHEISAIEGIDQRTVYKDIDAACEKLSALIFGIDGIKQE